jgi:hypothetical protein
LTNLSENFKPKPGPEASKNNAQMGPIHPGMSIVGKEKMENLILKLKNH